MEFFYDVYIYFLTHRATTFGLLIIMIWLRPGRWVVYNLKDGSYTREESNFNVLMVLLGKTICALILINGLLLEAIPFIESLIEVLLNNRYMEPFERYITDAIFDGLVVNRKNEVLSSPNYEGEGLKVEAVKAVVEAVVEIDKPCSEEDTRRVQIFSVSLGLSFYASVALVSGYLELLEITLWHV